MLRSTRTENNTTNTENQMRGTYDLIKMTPDMYITSLLFF